MLGAGSVFTAPHTTKDTVYCGAHRPIATLSSEIKSLLANSFLILTAVMFSKRKKNMSGQELQVGKQTRHKFLKWKKVKKKKKTNLCLKDSKDSMMLCNEAA